MGIDPGLEHTGYGVLQVADTRPRVIEMGVLATDRRCELGDRLQHLHKDVEQLLRDVRPSLVVLEDLFTHPRFPRTSIVLGHARGVICLAVAASGARIVTLAPSVVKRAVTGSGRATKAQVQQAVRALLGLRRLPEPHAADALALACAGLARLRTVSR